MMREAQLRAAPAEAAGLDVLGVTADSRQVAPGWVFAALPGLHSDGRAFIGEAVARGAVAVIAPTGTAWPPGVPPRPLIEENEPRRALAMLAAARAGAQPRHLVAVTGTNGKTSTVEFLRQLWADAALPAASLGTLGVIAPGEAGGGGLTTPDPVQLAATLARLAQAGVQHAAMEASSHGLDQFRLDGVRLAAAGFSNLTRDHLDYHGSEDAYRGAKLRLFGALLPAGSPAVVNADMDAATLAALREIAAARRLSLQTVGEGGGLLRLLAATPLPDGQVLQVEAHGVRRELWTPLPGRFQADNVLLAAGLALATGLADALDRVARLTGVRGRMELAARLDNGAAAYVDYAHTSDALDRLLAALRPHVGPRVGPPGGPPGGGSGGRLVCVFGAGGDRDPGKRPLMGAAVARRADLAIVTDDNPRGEDPAAIRRAVLAGCTGMAAGAAIEIGDRRAAIAAGLAALGPGDVLAVAGKGHEQGQTVAGTVLPFDDLSAIRVLAG